MKNLLSLIVVGCKAGFGIVLQSERTLVIRSVAVFLIIVLLTPVFLFNPIWQVQARSNSLIQSPAPISAPPEPFVIGSAQSTVSNSIVSSLSSVKEYFSAPQLPKGFEIAKVPTFSERTASALGTTFGFIFGTSGSSAKSNDSTVLPGSLYPVTNNTSSNTIPANTMFGQLSGAVDFDFDGDSKADIGRWHASNSEWKIKNSSNGNFQTHTIGTASSVIAPGDFDGDGVMDAAVFNAGTWTIRKSSNAQTITPSFGTTGDKPVVGDYDGDGISDLAIFRPSTNTWWIHYSSTATTGSVSFGSTGDIPVQGKFDNDASTDIALFRPSTGDWHVQGSTSGYYTVHWGSASDIPVPADYTGDGRTDLAVYRGATGTWYVLKSEDYSSYLTQAWGNYGDQPTPADYDGDGKADYSVWRPTTGMWYTIKSNGNVYDYQTLGVAGDTAVSSAYLKQIGGLVYSYDFAKIRLSPKNSTGGTDLYSRNFSWGTGLVGLPGRAGLDAGFGISYNSLIWTKDPATNTIVFDADNSNVTPGFRMGFPTIEPVYYDAQTGKFAYMMIAPSGSRVEFRQTAASNVYETADSSYTQLKINGSGTPNDAADSLTITVTNTSGTNMLYEWKNGAYRCQKITDRNGNYIEINHHADGRLNKVTDTLGREITVNYTIDGYPNTITQTWKDNNGEGPNTVTRIWATFSYTTQAINTDFSESNVPLTVIGPGGGYSLKVLQKITFPTETNGAGPHTAFTYNTWGQVTKVTNYAADNSALNYTEINLPATQSSSATDCPRFSITKSWAQNFNLVNGTAQPIEIKNDTYENEPYNVGGHSGTATMIEVSMIGHPHGAVSKSFVANSGWKEGLPIATEDWANGTSGSERKRWTWSDWTQDNTNLSYALNPRVVESKVGDSANIKRTTAEYYLLPESTVSNYGLVKNVKIYDANQTTVLKRYYTEYNLDAPYKSRRIIGLPLKTELYDGNDFLMSKTTYLYDEGQFDDAGLAQNISPIQHDNGNYAAAFLSGRGNLTSVTRHNVLGQSTPVTSSIKYNTAGAVVAQSDSLGGQVKINYADSFNDGNNARNTFAFPTKIYDPADNYSEVRYRFDTGANVWAKSPSPEGQTVGKITTRTFDSYGRLLKEALVKDNAEYSYTRYEYQSPGNGIQSKVYSTVTDMNNNGVGDLADEVLSETWTDGAGRVRFLRTKHPGSGGGWKAMKTEYDILGRMTRSTVPTEINPVNPANPSTWTPYGDDDRGIDVSNNPVWLWNSQEYDWKGRVTREVNTDGTDKLTDYEGCGCAGGEVVTEKSEQITDAGRRVQKTYHDTLGRAYKIDTLSWNGASVYSSKVIKYNCRDKAEWVKEYSGAAPAGALDDETCPSGTCQITKMTYDGFGRLKTQKQPEFAANTNTTWEYNDDDTVQNITDPRGAMTNFLYNSRKQVTTVSSVPNGSTMPNAPTVTFAYDAAGNRKQMTDSYGTVNYTFDSLSRITSETRPFSNLNVTHTIGYDYTLSGRIKEINDPADVTRKINYSYNEAGILTGMSGNGYGNVTNYLQNRKVRSTGAVKQQDNGNGVQMNVQYDNRQRISLYEVTKPSQSQQLAQYAYNYTEANQLKNITNPSGATIYDSYFAYDHIGRLTNVSSPTQPEVGGAFSYTMNYDAWNNLTYKYSGYWIGAEGSYYSNVQDDYTNNRVTNAYIQDRRGLNSWVWQYDTAGNPTQTGMQTHVYNSAGEKTQSIEHLTPTPPGNNGTVELKIQQEYDGQGEIIKRYERETFTAAPVREKTTYYLRSTVLGNAVLAELNTQGQKETEFVYDGNGEPLAKRGNDQVNWMYMIPQTANKFEVNSSGTVSGSSASDPLGGELVPQPPPTGSPDWLPSNSSYNGSGNPLGGLAGGGGCLYNGFPEDCSTVARIVSVGNPLAMGYGMSLYLLQMTVARSFTRVGTRESGYRWGRRTVIDRDNQGRITRLYEGAYNTDRSLHYSTSSAVYSSNNSFSTNLPEMAQTRQYKVPDSKSYRNCIDSLAALYGAKVKSISTVQSFNKFNTTIDINGTTYTINTSGSSTAEELGKEWESNNNLPHTGTRQSGLTSHYAQLGNNVTNFIAKEVYADSRTYIPGAYFILQYHELGNAIALIIFNSKSSTERAKLKSPFDLAGQATAQGDKDAGVIFERCLYGGIVNIRTGTVGNTRGF